MKRLYITFILLMVMVCTYAQTVTIDGDAFLEYQPVHDSIQVVFERTAPGSFYDTTYTGLNGYFFINIPTGIYNIYYSRKGFLPISITGGKPLYYNTTLADTTLEIKGLFGSLKDTLHTAFYKVTGDIEVTAGNTLVIEPGVRLFFKQDIKFNIKGLLIAAGTKTDSIVFTRYADGIKWGGVKFINADTNSVLSYCLIEYSGLSGISIESTSLSLNHLLIRKNESHSASGFSGKGGGIYIYNSNYNSNIILDNVVIIDNISDCEGGGIFQTSAGNSAGNLTITNSEISTNLAIGMGGGAIWFVDGSMLTLTNVKINKNKCGDSEGTAICYKGQKGNKGLVLTNVEMIENVQNDSTSWGGPAIFYQFWTAIPDTLYLVLTNVTIANKNKLGCSTEGIYLEHGASEFCRVSMTNCIITGHKWATNFGPSASLISNINNCNFWNNGVNFKSIPNSWLLVNITTNANGDSCDGFFNIQRDPMFVDTANGDYHLQAGSPCIDAGVNDSVTVQMDLDWYFRIWDGDKNGTSIVDMGPYECNSSPYVIDTTIISISEKIIAHNILKIYPNPSNGTFSVSITGITNNVELSLTNLQGQEVYKEQLNTTSNYTKQLDMSGYPKGIYFLKLMNEDIVRVEKVIVQ